MRILMAALIAAAAVTACAEEPQDTSGLQPAPPSEADTAADAPTTVNPLPGPPQTAPDTPPVLPEVIPEANPPVAPK